MRLRYISALVILILSVSVLYMCLYRRVPSEPFYILSYHSVSPEKKSNLSITPSVFEQEIEHLLTRGYSIVSLDEIMKMCRENKKLNKKIVAITFDDSWKDQYTYALPVLQKRNIVASFFIWTGVVGEKDRLSKEDIRQLDRAGMIIGGHTLTHPDLANLVGNPRMTNEIAGSKTFIEEILGKEVTSFSYPYNSLPLEAVKIVRESGYAYARTSVPGTNMCGDNPHTLKSFIVTNSFEEFKALFETGN